MRKFLLRMGLMALPAALCAPTCTFVDQTFTLGEAHTLTSVHLDHEDNDAPWCLYTGGLGGEELRNPPDSGTVVAGYDHSWDPGSGLFPCWEKIDHAYRGAVSFDIDSLHRATPEGALFESATLFFRYLGGQGRDANGNSSTASCEDFRMEWLEATEAWIGGHLELIPGDHVADMSQAIPVGDELALDVTDVVGRWFYRTHDNNGFVIKGNNEAYPRDQAICWYQLGDFRLEVKLAVRVR